MRKGQNPPWNPPTSARVSPTEYEQQVVVWLKRSGRGLENLRVEHLVHLEGTGGDYEFDAAADFTIFSGASIKILAECKRYSRPVEREKLLALEAKRQAVCAHKAMIFSTSGYQRGAIEYAGDVGIATVVFVEGRFSYETKSADRTLGPPALPPGLPKFGGIVLQPTAEGLRGRTINDSQVDALGEWFAS